MSYQSVKARFAEDIKHHEMKIFKDDGVYRHLRFSKPTSSAYYFDIVTWPGCLSISGDMGCHVFSRENDMILFFKKADYKNAEELMINPQYWAEKIISGRDGVEVLSMSKFKDYVDRDLDHQYEDFVGQRKDEIEMRLQDEDSEEDVNENKEWLDLKDLFLKFKAAVYSSIEGDLEFETLEELYRCLSNFDGGDFLIDHPEFSDFIDYNKVRFEDIESNWTEYSMHYLWRCCAIAHAVKSYLGHVETANKEAVS